MVVLILILVGIAVGVSLHVAFTIDDYHCYKFDYPDAIIEFNVFLYMFYESPDDWKIEGDYKWKTMYIDRVHNTAWKVNFSFFDALKYRRWRRGYLKDKEKTRVVTDSIELLKLFQSNLEEIIDDQERP